MITVVDYGMGNLRSVAKALEKVGLDVKVSSDPEDVLNSKLSLFQVLVLLVMLCIILTDLVCWIL